MASADGRGFVVPEAEVLAQTRAGRQVLNVDPLAPAAFCAPVEEGDDHVACTGSNRKMLVFPLDEVPEMTRGKGVTLQRHKDGRMADVKVLRLADGLTWQMGTKTRTESDLAPWLGKRTQAGLTVPRGFPRDNRFGQGGHNRGLTKLP